MQRLLLAICLVLFLLPVIRSSAQSGCPGCVVNLPANLPADTVYLPHLPDGTKNVYYDANIPFRLPVTTTAVAALDSTIPPGLPISKFEIVALEGLPNGLSWQPNQWVFETAVQTDGCIRICGTPTVADSFVLTVRLKATVFFLTQESTFPLRLYIAPEVSTTDGFAMSNFNGCGPTTVSFSNNIPSGGNPGFTYTWDFGDSTSYTGENPPSHTYTDPGVYTVQYHATIDTTGYVLQGITVLSVDCTDPFGSPDLYMRLFDPANTMLLNTSPAINNTPLPWYVPLNLVLENGNYQMDVADEDSGIKGSDDLCGTISFNYLSNDTIVSGGFQIVLHIEKPITEVLSTDTVQVFWQPPVPLVNAPQGFSACVDANPVVLVSSFGAGNHWWLDGAPIPGAESFVYSPATNGHYQVQVITPDGCAAISDSAWVEYYPLPQAPVVTAPSGFTGCIGGDPVALQSSYALGNQWLHNGEEIANANNASYAAPTPGYYQVAYTSPEGCSSLSDSVLVTFLLPPLAPEFNNNNNLLRLLDTLALPNAYALQWYAAGLPIPDATGFTYCATESGNYSLQVTDSNTGCVASFAMDVTFNPAFDCTVGIHETFAGAMRVYPNPVSALGNIELPAGNPGGTLRIWEPAGRLIASAEISSGSVMASLDFSDVPAGLCLLEWTGADGYRIIGKIKVVH